MQIITDSSSSRPRQTIGYFSRPELQRILNVYARRVASGDWRDYSIDHLEDRAFFSIYRSSRETPLFTIEKKRLKGSDRWLYSLSHRTRVIKSGARLVDILEKLKSLPRLVNA